MRDDHPPVDTQQVPTFREDDLAEHMRERLVYWQEILRLQDWQIDLRIVRGYDLEYRGEISPLHEKKMAILKLLDPRDIDPARMPDPETGTPYDPELTLIHELAHLHLEPFTRSTKASEDEDSLEHAAMEMAIDSFSKALWNLERRGARARHPSGTAPPAPPPE